MVLIARLVLIIRWPLDQVPLYMSNKTISTGYVNRSIEGEGMKLGPMYCSYFMVTSLYLQEGEHMDCTQHCFIDLWWRTILNFNGVLMVNTYYYNICQGF